MDARVEPDAMVAVIRMGREFGYAKLEAVGRASAGAGLHGCGRDPSSPHDRRACSTRPATTVEIGALAAYERPLPTMAEYNQLLTIEVPA